MAGSVKDVLTALDDSKTKLYHFKAVIVSGMGFFTDAYDLFSVSLITKLLGRIYYHVPGSAKPGTLPPTAMSALNGVALCGTLLGQLFFGLLGDKMGRKKVYGFTLFIMALSSIGSGFSFGHSPKNVIATLCFFRFWLGFGIGGDYPLSATIMAEYASKKTRGSFIAAVFAMQGFGILTGGLVGMAISGIFKAVYGGSLDSDGVAPAEADYIWRIVLMFGALPALLTYYWRTQMPETARYTALVAKNADQARKDMEKVLNVKIIGVGSNNNNVRAAGTGDKTAIKQPFGLFSKQFLSRHGLHLLGTSMCWFFVDVAYYSQNLFQKEIFTAVGWLPSAKSMGAIEEVFKISYCQFLIAFCGTVPGYWLTVALIDRIGRFAIQIIGFLFMTIFMFGLAIPYEHWLKNHAGFLVMYGLTFFFANFGPNSTTFIVPAEIFPARLRSTCHGISAAAGKAGAIVGAFGFMYAAQNRDKSKADPGYGAGIGIRYSLMILGGINLLGLLFTFLVPEAKGRSLEDMSGENDEDDEAAEIKEVQMLQNV